MVVLARCITSSVHTLEWNEPVSCSEVGEGIGEGEADEVEEDSRPSIPVRAYFISTRLQFLSLFCYFGAWDDQLCLFFHTRNIN